MILGLMGGLSTLYEQPAGFCGRQRRSARLKAESGLVGRRGGQDGPRRVLW